MKSRHYNMCPARMVVPNTSAPNLTRIHSHEPYVMEVHLAKFKMALRRRAGQENTGMAEIFRTEEIRHPDASRVFPGFASIRASMYRRRKAGNPPVPHNLQQYAELIMSPR